MPGHANSPSFLADIGENSLSDNPPNGRYPVLGQTPLPRLTKRGFPGVYTRISAAGPCPRKAEGLAVAPYAPAQKTATRSPTSARGKSA